MAVGNVSLNGVGFQAVPVERDGEALLVQRESIDQYGVVFRTGGAQRQEDISTYTAFIFPNFMQGLGRDRIDSDSAQKVNEYRRFRDSTCETRFGRDVRLPILEENMTQSGLEVVRDSELFRGNLVTMWEDDTSNQVVARTNTSSNTAWANGGNIGHAGTIKVGLALKSQKDQLLALIANANDHLVYRASDVGAATWAAASVQPAGNLLKDSVGVHEDIDAGLLEVIGGEAVAILWHEANGTITFFSSTDAGDNWDDEAIDLPGGDATNGGVKGVAVMTGPDNEDKLYVGTESGLFEVDTAPSTWTFRLIFPMATNIDNCRRMKVMQDGALWFAQGVSDDTPPIVYRMFVSNAERRIERVPNDFSLGDGLPEEAMGPIRWMEAAQGMVYVSAGGGKVGRNARVWCHNGDGWHSMRRHGTEDQKIEWITAGGEATPFFHYAIRTGAAASDSKFLAQPFVNPASGASIKREAQGFIDLPYIDAGMPLISKGFLQVGINAEDLSPTNSGEFINVDFGEDDGSGGLNARTNTDLGDYLSGTSIRKFGSSAGLSSRNLGLRINLHQDATTNTNTPKLKDVEIDVLPHVKVLQRFSLRIDIRATALLEDKTSESVITELETARDLVTLPIFRYGNITATNVLVKRLRWIETLYNPGGSVDTAPNTLTQRTGFADLVLEEVIR
jgi:hypothetical protein